MEAVEFKGCFETPNPHDAGRRDLTVSASGDMSDTWLRAFEDFLAPIAAHEGWTISLDGPIVLSGIVDGYLVGALAALSDATYAANSAATQ